MGVVRELTEKPWLTPGLAPSNEDAQGAPPLPATAVGLRVYLCVATVMFLLIAAVFTMRMGEHGISTGQQADWKPMVWPPLLWFNTGVLVLNSAAWEWACFAARRGQAASFRAGLVASGALSIVFLVGQLTVWRQLEAAGCGITTTTMSAFFHLITALHGAHLLGGLAVWGRTTANVLAEDQVVEVQSVELCATYWHFLLLVWLVMFGLLLIT